MRVRSAVITASRSESASIESDSFFSAAKDELAWRTSSRRSWILKRDSVKFIFPAEIFAISRTSLIRWSRCWPFLWMRCRSLFMFSVSSPSIPSSITSVKPRIEFKGVRNSWLMFARKEVFSRSSSRSRVTVPACSMYRRAFCRATATWEASVV